MGETAAGFVEAGCALYQTLNSLSILEICLDCLVCLQQLKIRMCIEHCVTRRSSLLRDRHLDQVLLAVLKVISAVNVHCCFTLIGLKQMY